jgi:L-rhamnose-H+ transport protein
VTLCVVRLDAEENVEAETTANNRKDSLMSLFAEASGATSSVLGVLIFILGGLAGAVFYLPFKKVKNWAWESYWLVYAVIGLVVVPWGLAFCMSPNVISVLRAAPGKEIGYCFLCGAMWGLGGLTWGLMIRYLGVGLGLAIGCGLCSAAGSLIPPLVKPILERFVSDTPITTPLADAIAAGAQTLYGTPAANAALVSVCVSLIGIFFVGGAGMSKESELSEDVKKATVAEYNFKLGLLVAIFSGLTSAAMNFGLSGGQHLEKLATTTPPITNDVWKWLPVLVVVLLGGFAVNFLWCLFLNLKNKTTGDYVKLGAPLAMNFIFAGLAGALWCAQMICLKRGEPVMGPMAYIGWSVMFSGMILFSTIFGIALGEWRNTSSRTRMLLTLGLICLVASSVISGYSGSLK